MWPRQSLRLTDRDAARLQADLEKAGSTGVDGRQDGSGASTAIVVTGIPAGKRAMLAACDGQDYGNYEVATGTDGSLTLTMKQAAIRDRRRSAR